MKGRILKLLLVITASLMLAACSSHKTKSDSAQGGARVEDRGAAGANGAASQGLADDGSAGAGGALNDPNSPLAVWFTLIPFWSPLATPVRWGATPIPLIELVASLAILVSTVLLVTWIASRIYRVGILMTGKRPSVKELVRWVRAA